MKLLTVCEIEIPEDFGTFQEAERKIKEAMFQAGQGLMSELMGKYEERILETRKSFRKKDLREKKFQTLAGEIRRKRWRVFDWKEKRCRIPLDEWMEVGSEKATPALKQALVTAAVQRPYRQATKEVEQWTGVKRSVMANWQLVQSVAKEEMAEEPPVPDWHLKLIPALDPEMKEDPCPILAIDPDATYVKNQKADEPDHEVKMAILYTKKVPEGRKKKRWKLGNKRVVFSRLGEEVSDFFSRVTQMALACYGAHRETQVVVHGDGDPWIKGLKIYFWDEALLRLDPWHVGKKIRLATGEKEVPKAWWESIYGKPDLLIGQLNFWKVAKTAPHSPQREKMEDLIGYLRNNREGLLPSGIPKEVKQKYPGMFRRGSGTIESNIGHGLCDRFKQRRMSWSKDGLDHLLYLREKFLNGPPKKLFHVPEPIGRDNWRKLADEVGL